MTYSQNLAAHLSYLCQLSYTPPANIEYNLTEYSIVHIEDKETDTQGFIAIDDKTLTVVFRGSTTVQDWITDLNTSFTSFMDDPELVAHEGFSEAYLSVHDQVREVVDQHLDKKLYVTGHSLGAALANLSFVALSYNEAVGFDGLYTFGCPRVFSEASTGHLNSSFKDVHYRVVNNNDIVTHIPPEITGYSHWGHLVYIEEDGTVALDPQLSWWVKLQNMLSGYIDDIGEVGLDSIKDHDINDYNRYLKLTDE